jgi:hypothetical protein
MWDDGTIVNEVDEGPTSTGEDFSGPHTSEANKDDLPIASPVLPSPELLDRFRQVEKRDRQALPIPSATPMDPDEENNMRLKRKQKQWLFLACLVAVTALGVSLPFSLRTAPSPATQSTNTSPTPSPASDNFASLKSLIASVSFDNGVALSDPTSPQYNALMWLDNLEAYPNWKRIQWYALAVLYYSTNGENWQEIDGWMTDEDECTWLTHDTENPACNDNGAYYQITLYRNNLDGTVPLELALLSNSLFSLDFTGDNVTGTLPTELGLLTNLGILQFDVTNLSGSIPTELGRLDLLGNQDLYIVLQGNMLIGTIPTEVVGVANLRYFSLYKFAIWIHSYRDWNSFECN